MQIVINIQKKDIMLLLVGLAIFGGVAVLYAGTVTIPNSFTAGTTAVADEVNANFTAVKTAVDDNASDITTNTTNISTKAPTASPTFTGTVTFSSATNIDLVASQTSALTFESTLLNLDTTNSYVGIGTATPSATLEVNGGFLKTCPSGFTSIQVTASNDSVVRQLGCMQTAEEGNAIWETAADDCFDTYGGRLPSSAEWYIAMVNFALTDETDAWEWNAAADNTGVADFHALSGLSAITSQNIATDSTGTDYRCWIPT